MNFAGVDYSYLPGPKWSSEIFMVGGGDAGSGNASRGDQFNVTVAGRNALTLRQLETNDPTVYATIGYGNGAGSGYNVFWPVQLQVGVGIDPASTHTTQKTDVYQGHISPFRIQNQCTDFTGSMIQVLDSASVSHVLTSGIGGQQRAGLWTVCDTVGWTNLSGDNNSYSAYISTGYPNAATEKPLIRFGGDGGVSVGGFVGNLTFGQIYNVQQDIPLAGKDNLRVQSNVVAFGSASMLPNQTASTPSNIMTRALSDARYLQRNGGVVSNLMVQGTLVGNGADLTGITASQVGAVPATGGAASNLMVSNLTVQGALSGAADIEFYHSDGSRSFFGQYQDAVNTDGSLNALTSWGVAGGSGGGGLNANRAWRHVIQLNYLTNFADYIEVSNGDGSRWMDAGMLVPGRQGRVRDINFGSWQSNTPGVDYVYDPGPKWSGSIHMTGGGDVNSGNGGQGDQFQVNVAGRTGLSIRQLATNDPTVYVTVGSAYGNGGAIQWPAQLQAIAGTIPGTYNTAQIGDPNLGGSLAPFRMSNTATNFTGAFIDIQDYRSVSHLFGAFYGGAQRGGIWSVDDTNGWTSGFGSGVMNPSSLYISTARSGYEIDTPVIRFGGDGGVSVGGFVGNLSQGNIWNVTQDILPAGKDNLRVQSNVVAFGSASMLPNQTASTPSNIMTRALSDARYLQQNGGVVNNDFNVSTPPGTHTNSIGGIGTNSFNLVSDSADANGFINMMQIMKGDTVKGKLGFRDNDLGGVQFSSGTDSSFVQLGIGNSMDMGVGGSTGSQITITDGVGVTISGTGVGANLVARGDIIAANASNTAPSHVANVGTLDGRYLQQSGGVVSNLTVASNAVFQSAIGIGTNAPAAMLHVNGNGQFNGAVMQVGATSTNSFAGPVQIVRLLPQGDLSMGAFTNAPPQ